MEKIQNKQIHRSTLAANIFPNQAALLRLVCSVLMKTSDESETWKFY
ncbi:MAG: transposase [Deltaproteobacteria bacterium]|nr:transposase [Deltaproteobacteria bacterium]MBF0523681.1 transposase [Deltaproteobacteria bacterium]